MTTTVTDYKTQADQLLESMSVVFHAQLVGHTCPAFCEDAKCSKDMGLVGKFPRKSHIHGDQFRVSFTRRTKVSEAYEKPIYDEKRDAPVFYIDFWDSYHDAEIRAIGTVAHRQGRTSSMYPMGQRWSDVESRMIPARVKPMPSAYDVLACITKQSPSDFEDFCSDYGYSNDSIQSLETYNAVCAEWKKVKGFFTADEINQLQEIS